LGDQVRLHPEADRQWDNAHLIGAQAGTPVARPLGPHHLIHAISNRKAVRRVEETKQIAALVRPVLGLVNEEVIPAEGLRVLANQLIYVADRDGAVAKQGNRFGG